jgi:hypothetical protein
LGAPPSMSLTQDLPHFLRLYSVLGEGGLPPS